MLESQFRSSNCYTVNPLNTTRRYCGGTQGAQHNNELNTVQGEGSAKTRGLKRRSELVATQSVIHSSSAP